MAKSLWAGLDIGAETTSICVIDDAGEVVHEATCPTELSSVMHEIAFLRRRRSARVGLETGLGVPLARGLRKRGYNVDIYEARQLSKFLRVRRNKTDSGDANGIAQAGRLAAPLVSRVHLKSLETQSLGLRLRIRRFLVRARTRAHSFLCRQLEQFGGRVRTNIRSPKMREDVVAQIRKCFGKTPSAAGRDLLQLLHYCEAVMEREKALNKELEAFARTNPVCQRLMEVPGVGPICALHFYAAIDDPHRFRQSAAVGAYLGLTPRIHQSGLSQRRGRISRMGNSEARSLLVQAAIAFVRSTKPGLALRDWTIAIEQRRGRGKSRVALARKLAIVMLAIWKSGRSYSARLSELPSA